MSDSTQVEVRISKEFIERHLTMDAQEVNQIPLNHHMIINDMWVDGSELIALVSLFEERIN